MSNTLLKHVTLLVVADKGSQDFLRAAQCTYMATLDPAQIIFVSDFPLPEVGGCGLPVSNRIRVVSAVDYLEVLKTVERSKKVLLPWVLVVKPWTFVHPGHLEAYLEERGSQNPEVYVGRVRNATSELAALSQMPHVAYEYGILMRAWAAVLVGKDKPEFEGFRSNMRHDFHTVESGIADIAATLYATLDMVAPVERSDRFVATFPVFEARNMEPGRRDKAITIGPLPRPESFFDLADLYGMFHSSDAETRLSAVGGVDEQLHRYREESSALLPASASPTPPPRVLYAVLAREDSLSTVVKDAMETWASGEAILTSGSSVLFFYSSAEVAKQTAAEDFTMRSELSEVMATLASGKAGKGVRRLKFHPKRDDPLFMLTHPVPCEVSENLAPAPDGGQGAEEGSQVRLVGLALPPQPQKTSSTFYQKSMAKPMEWNVWLRAKVAAMTAFLGAGAAQGAVGPLGHTSRLSLAEYSWFVVLDDDTYVKVPQFLAAMASHDPSSKVAVGRKFFCEKKGTLLGGGPGIAMSAATVRALHAEKCAARSFPVISHSVPGGDGWLGQCMNSAKVVVEHDWRFKSLPPYAFAPNQQAHAISFHKSHVREVHGVLQGAAAPPRTLQGQAAAEAAAAGGWDGLKGKLEGKVSMGAALAQPSPLCRPVLLRDLGEVLCLPLFTIIGAQKAGTTSLFEYLGEHPQVRLPKEKELNFFGSPWPLTRGRHRLQSLGSFTFNYLRKFRLAGPLDAGPAAVTGEGSPDYLVATRNVLPNILRFAPSMKVVVSLREPLDRFLSAYKNKVVDKTVRRHVDETLWHGKVDKRKDDEVPGYHAPTADALVSRVAATLFRCPDHAKHYTLAERPPSAVLPPPNSTTSGGAGAGGGGHEPAAVFDRGACYVNPFVLHGYYAKYLRPWVNAYGGAAGNLFIMEFEAFKANEGRAMDSLRAWLGLRPFTFNTSEVFNSRGNRGVHAAAPDGRQRTGGVINGVAKAQLASQLGSWVLDGSGSGGDMLSPSSKITLVRYYERPLAELRDLLGESHAISWIKPGYYDSVL